MTANFNGTITGLQASIGDLDINVNDARNIFNQNLGNTNLNMENHEDLNQNLNSNVNPIGSGEIVPKQTEGLNDVKVDNNINQNDINQLLEALKFVDNLNLFMEELDVKKFKDKIKEAF